MLDISCLALVILHCFHLPCAPTPPTPAASRSLFGLASVLCSIIPTSCFHLIFSSSCYRSITPTSSRYFSLPLCFFLPLGRLRSFDRRRPLSPLSLLTCQTWRHGQLHFTSNYDAVRSSQPSFSAAGFLEILWNQMCLLMIDSNETSVRMVTINRATS